MQQQTANSTDAVVVSVSQASKLQTAEFMGEEAHVVLT
jgi:hypothetical protein